MYDKLTPKQQAANAYKYGVKDATEGRERKNASDFYGPYADDYLSGYQSVVNSQKKTKGKYLDHLSEFFKF